MDQAFKQQLGKILGEANILTNKVDLLTYSYDATPDLNNQWPDIVVLPTTTAQIQEIVRLAGEAKQSIYSRGAGTNLSGGTIPVNGGIVVSLQKMNKIIEIDRENLSATVQPGVIVQELNDAVAPYGLIYPPDPGTVATATMGGTVAECAGGLRALKYGVTKHYVMGMEVVLAGGESFRFGGKTVKNVTGYDFASLFVGSEGTLGIITEITVKLIPAPKYRRTMMATFRKLENAGNAVTCIIMAYVIPATLELMDQVTIQAVENYAKAGLPGDAAGLLLIELDGMGRDVVEAEAETIMKIVREKGGEIRLAGSDAERDQLWAARRAALPALARVRPTIILEDATVPRNKIAEMLGAIQKIAARYNVPIGTFGHAGDGNLHPTLLTDARDQEEMERVHKAIDDIFSAALELGGTLSGEHGIGMAKMKYLQNELGQIGFEVIRRIKESLDPEYLFNPGKMIPLKKIRRL